MFVDIDKLLPLIGQPIVHTHEGTCELCNHSSRQLSDAGGLLICDLCRNGITARLKEGSFPFPVGTTGFLRSRLAEITIPQSSKGNGPRGQRKPLPR